MTIIRSVWIWLSAIIGTAALSTLTILGALVRHRGGLYEWIARSWARWIVWNSPVKIDVEGIEHVSAHRPQVIAINHQSWYDVFAIAAVLPKRFRFIAKEELRRIPLFGLAWSSAGHISINRQDRKKAIAALDAAAELVREDNSSIVIFPEGTRSWDGQLGPFKKGAFMLALRTGIEIVPTAVIGSRAILKKGDWRVYPGRIIVRFGEPIDTSTFGEDNREDLMNLVRDRVAYMLAHPESQREQTDV